MNVPGAALLCKLMNHQIGNPGQTIHAILPPRSWRQRLNDQISALIKLRDGLDSCIGCGCLSLRRCALSNPADVAAGGGPGAAYFPWQIRRGDRSPGR